MNSSLLLFFLTLHPLFQPETTMFSRALKLSTALKSANKLAAFRSFAQITVCFSSSWLFSPTNSMKVPRPSSEASPPTSRPPPLSMASSLPSILKITEVFSSSCSSDPSATR